MTGQARLRILVIDDDSFLCFIVSKLLGTMVDCDVSTHTDARLAVPSVDSGWDLLLLDLTMPGWEGIEFLSEMAAASVKPPVVFSNGEEDRILEVAEATNRRALSSIFSLIFSLNFWLMLSLMCWGDCESTTRCLERQKSEGFGAHG